MEGNDCYKFSTVRHYIERTGAPPIRVAVDIGTNIGEVALLMTSYFPGACVFAFEAVTELAEIARATIRQHEAPVRVIRRAITAERAPLEIMRARPDAGAGWIGGSFVRAAEPGNAAPVRGYDRLAQRVRPLTFDRMVELILARTGADVIDLVKMDCEGCEHSALGSATSDTLARVRYIVGEYHGIGRFYLVMRDKLFATHKVSLIGDADLGAFFAERLDGNQDGILRFDKRGMLLARPWLCDIPIDWHLFNETYVLPDERAVHALP